MKLTLALLDPVTRHYHNPSLLPRNHRVVIMLIIIHIESLPYRSCDRLKVFLSHLASVCLRSRASPLHAHAARCYRGLSNEGTYGALLDGEVS